MIDFPTPVVALSRLKVPRKRSTAATRRCAATWPRRCGPAPTTSRRRRRPGVRGASPRASPGPRAARREIDRLRAELRAHPCHACPDREDHARWAERWFKLDRDGATLRRRVEKRTNTVARQFDRVCEVLTALGYLDGDAGEVRVTERGPHLMRLYSELDLVAAECAAHRAAGTTSPRLGLAAALSVLVFEARRPDDASSPRVPGGTGPRGDQGDGPALGPARRPGARPPARLPAPARTPASRGRRTAGPRATSSTTC